MANLGAEFDAAKQAYDQLVSERSKLSERVELQESTLSKTRAQVSESRTAVAGLLELWGRPQPDFDGGEWPGAKFDAQADIETQLAQATRELATEKSSVDTTLGEHKKVGQSAKQAQTDQAKRQDELNASTKLLQDEKAKLAAKENVAQGLATRHQHAQAGVEEALAVLGKHDFAPGWQVDLRAGVDAFVHRQEERVTQWRTHHRQHDDATRAIPVVDAEFKAFESRKATATKRLGKLGEQLTEATKTLGGHRNRRNQLFAGQPCPDVDARLTALA